MNAKPHDLLIEKLTAALNVLSHPKIGIATGPSVSGHELQLCIARVAEVLNALKAQTLHEIN